MKLMQCLPLLLLAHGVFLAPTAQSANADLSISITSSPNPASAGSNLTYTIRLTNAGPDTATGVMITNTLSNGQHLVPGTNGCPSPGPVAWWKAENDAQDSAGTNHGTAHNGATFAPGKVGTAFSFDGTDDYFAFPDSASLHPESFTVEGWFQPADVSGVRILIAKAIGSSFYNSFAIYINEGTFNALVSDENTFAFLNDTNTITVGQWYHIAYTFDDALDVHTLYVNGVSVDSDTAFRSIPYDANPILIGADVDDGTNPDLFYSGLVDEVSIYDRALSVTEIAQIYNVGSNGKCATSTLLSLGEVPSATATNIVLWALPTLCSGSLTNIVNVMSTSTDPTPANNTATNRVTVADLTSPTIVCPPDIMTNLNAGSCTISLALGTPVANDNCTVASLTSNAPAMFPVGVTTVTWTVMDGAGRSANCQQVVTVLDTQPPSINCPSDVMVNVDPGLCTATNVVLGTPTRADNCGATTLTNDAPNPFPSGDTIVTWTVTDTAGNTATCQQHVRVIETEPPTITCAGPLSVECFSEIFTPFPGGNTINDNCGPPIASFVGDTYATNGCVITVFRTYKATDPSGNTATCIQTITVQDTLPPVIDCPPNLVVSCNDTNDIGSCANLTISDNCDTNVTVTYEPAEGSSFTAGTNLVRCVAVDDCGNTSMCDFTMVLMDDTPTLTIQRQGTSLKICWETETLGYVLREATSLLPNATWTPTSGEVVQNGTSHCVTTTTGPATKYYRLCMGCQ